MTDGITWMSPEQIDLLSDAEKKVVVNILITRITASFDRQTNKHQIDVTFSKTVARLLARPVGEQRASADDRDPQENASEVHWRNGEDCWGECEVKKSGGSRISSAADHAYPVTVE